MEFEDHDDGRALRWLYQAIERDDAEAARDALRDLQGSSLALQGHSPVVRASGLGSLGCLQALLDEANAPLNAFDGYGRSPLASAAQDAKTQALAWLLSHGAQPDLADEHGQTALMAACENSREPEMDLLLKAGANPNAATHGHRESPLLMAAERGLDGALRMLIQAGADIEQGDGRGERPLARAIRHSQKGAAALLIGLGANLESRDAHGMTPLLVACVKGNASGLAALLEAGADWRAVDVQGRSAREHAGGGFKGSKACAAMIEALEQKDALELVAKVASKSSPKRV